MLAEVTQRFVDTVALDDADLPLDEAVLLIAAHAHHGLDVDAELRRLDDLAAQCVEQRDAASLVHALFIDLGFTGNRADYSDPRNSYLDWVLANRLGIPITLSIVAIEVGRRIGVHLVGVGMPGHFLVRGRDDGATFFDPFDGGATLDVAGCRARFAAVHGGAAPFDPAYLTPTPARAVVGRVLANLEGALLAGGSADAAWAARLHLLVPGLAAADRRRAAQVLAAVGRHAEAANALEAIATEPATTAVHDDLLTRARALRARAN